MTVYTARRGNAPAMPRRMVDDLSLVYAHTPDDQASLHLDAYLRSIEAGIVEAVGASKAKCVS